MFEAPPPFVCDRPERQSKTALTLDACTVVIKSTWLYCLQPLLKGRLQTQIDVNMVMLGCFLLGLVLKAPYIWSDNNLEITGDLILYLYCFVEAVIS